MDAISHRESVEDINRWYDPSGWWCDVWYSGFLCDVDNLHVERNRVNDS